MRRKEREMDVESARAVLARGTICRLGLADEDGPYVVPMNYCLVADRVYLHSAASGRKIDALRRDPRVCVQVDEGATVVPGDKPWKCTTHYACVMAFGRARLVDDPEERAEALAALVRAHGHDCAPSDLPEKILDKTAVIRVDVERISGKHNG